MSKEKFTQGEWNICENWDEDYIEIGTSSQPEICLVNKYSIEENEAKVNAKLIAAAPDMLEALQNLENDDNSIPEHAWILVKDAIAKATDIS